MSKLQKLRSLKPKPLVPSQPDACPDHRSDPQNPEEASFLSFGDEADLKVLDRSYRHAIGVYHHTKPEDQEIAALAEKDFTKLSYQQVGQVMQYFTALYAYSVQLLARSDLEYTAAKRRKDALHAQLLLLNTADEPKYLTEAKVAKHPELRKANEETFRLGAFYEMLKSTNTGLQAKADLASREITRRAAERETQSRNPR